MLLQGCALLQCAAAKDAYLYTFNDERRSPSTNPDIISAETAFAIVSRRQGVADGLSLEGVDEQTLFQISEHGGYQQPLFSEATTEPARVLVRIQSNKPETTQTTLLHPTFKIQKPTKDLLNLEPQSPDGKNYTFGFASKEGVRLECRIQDNVSSSEKKKLLVLNGRPIAQVLRVLRSYLSSSVDLVSASIDVDFTQSKISQSTVTSQIDLFIEYLHTSISISNYQPTLLITPPSSQLAASTISLTKRQDPEEEPLDLILPSIPDLSFENPSTYKKNTTLPRRFPSCFNSMESCRNATNDCSGHGSCKASRSNKNCFQCKCGRTTIRTNEDGTKKTNLWAGGACQKKDISVEFTLFAVFGVTMAMLIMGVIGMMYSMGSQELPSVIGAGVAGPAARK